MRKRFALIMTLFNHYHLREIEHVPFSRVFYKRQIDFCYEIYKTFNLNVNDEKLSSFFECDYISDNNENCEDISNSFYTCKCFSDFKEIIKTKNNICVNLGYILGLPNFDVFLIFTDRELKPHKLNPFKKMLLHFLWNEDLLNLHLKVISESVKYFSDMFKYSLVEVNGAKLTLSEDTNLPNTLKRENIFEFTVFDNKL